MLTIEQAKKIVSDRLERSGFSDDDSLIVLDDFTIEKPYGWIFFYDSKLYQETKETRYIIAGNSPIIVDKKTGEQTSYASAYGLERMLQEYEDEKNIWNLVLTESNLISNTKLIALKNKMNINLQDALKLRRNATFCIDSGSEFRLKIIQTELINLGIETKLLLSDDNN